MPIFAKFTLDPEDIKTWGLFEWAVLVFLVTLLGLILFRVFADYRQVGVLKWYLVLMAAWFIGIYLNTKRVKPQGRYLHIHHYCIGFIVMSLICYQSVFLSMVHAFFNGLFIEGGARWGFDAIWEYPDPDPEPTER